MHDDLRAESAVLHAGTESERKTSASRVNAGGGGVGIHCMKLCRYVPPHGLWFLNRFGQKMVMNFTHLVMKVSVNGKHP